MHSHIDAWETWVFFETAFDGAYVFAAAGMLVLCRPTAYQELDSPAEGKAREVELKIEGTDA